MYNKYWPQMKAFALHTASTGYIRFNLKGREPEGIIEPDQYDRLCRELIEYLMELIEPRSGKPAVQKVYIRRENHKGPLAEQVMPDLFVEWADMNIEELHSPQFGHFGPVRNERSGTHRPRGIFFAIGAAGLSNGPLIHGGHARDLPATILSLMGEPIPEDMEGRVLFSP